MIQPQSLRIGNYVTVDNPKYHPNLSGKELRVIGISERIDDMFPLSTTVIKMSLGYDTYSQFDEFVKPIPLTEDILLRLGFEKGKFPNYVEISIMPKTKVYYNTNNGQCEISIYDYGYRFHHIKSVHELQNFYHSLTGTELTFKDKTS